MRNRLRLQWWLLRIKLKRDFQSFGEIVTHAISCALIVFPAIFAYFTLLTDTYTTVIGLHAFNMVETNPKYAHYNQHGVTGDDLFFRQMSATIYMIVFLIVGSALFAGKNPIWFWGIAYLVLWALLLADLFTVYSNVLQIAAKL